MLSLLWSSFWYHRYAPDGSTELLSFLSGSQAEKTRRTARGEHLDSRHPEIDLVDPPSEVSVRARWCLVPCYTCLQLSFSPFVQFYIIPFGISDACVYLAALVFCLYFLSLPLFEVCSSPFLLHASSSSNPMIGENRHGDAATMHCVTLCCSRPSWLRHRAHPRRLVRE